MADSILPGIAEVYFTENRQGDPCFIHIYKQWKASQNLKPQNWFLFFPLYITISIT